MSSLKLFDNGTHRNIFLEDYSEGHAVQANQHLIVDGKEGIILDPGGHKIYAKVMAETMTQLGANARLTHILLSHQDPDIVAAVNGWLMTTDATAWASNLWLRFIPHFGLDRLVVERLKGIGDGGMRLQLGACQLLILPAHFLHSPGNFQVYDPVSRILYSGDLGASVGCDYREVPNFQAHLPFTEGFHKRYMASNRAMKAWAAMARTLDIEIIAPQHGAIFKGKDMVKTFIDWCDGLACGVDLIEPAYKVPA